MFAVTSAKTVGATNVLSDLPPLVVFAILAPLETASAINSRIYPGFPSSGNGVKKTSFSKGIPIFKLSTAVANFSVNSCLISL